MVTAVCRTKPDLKVRWSSVRLERIWSTWVQSGLEQGCFTKPQKPYRPLRGPRYEPWTMSFSKGSKNMTHTH